MIYTELIRSDGFLAANQDREIFGPPEGGVFGVRQ